MHYRKLVLGILIIGILSLYILGIPPSHATVTISSASISPVDNAQTLDTTPDFSCTPVSDKDATVNVTLYVDGAASRTTNGHANNTEVTITCNQTLTEDDDKLEWYFSVTDSDGTTNTTPRDIGIGAYFKMPVELTNENATSEHWTYYLTESIVDIDVITTINIPDNNITLDGQHYTLDGTYEGYQKAIQVLRDSQQTTSCTIKNIVITEIDDYGVFFYKSNGNTVTNVTVSSTKIGILLISADNNLITNATTTAQRWGLRLKNSHSNTIIDSTILDCGTSGIVFYNTSVSNLFYNNYFRNDVNVEWMEMFELGSNDWNTAKQLGTRTYSGGDYIGGNYYGNPSGKGVSDLGQDTDGDGFLDSSYVLETGNIDWLAYSNKYPGGMAGTSPGVDPPIKADPKDILVVPDFVKQIPDWGYWVIFGAMGLIALGAVLNSNGGKPRKKRSNLQSPNNRKRVDMRRKSARRNNLTQKSPKRNDLRRKRGKHGRWA